MNTDGHEIKGGIDASQANLTVTIGIFSAPGVVAAVSEFGPFVFHGCGACGGCGDGA